MIEETEMMDSVAILKNLHRFEICIETFPNSQPFIFEKHGEIGFSPTSYCYNYRSQSLEQGKPITVLLDRYGYDNIKNALSRTDLAVFLARQLHL
ncbi:hypothetical protein JCM19046_1462 [Bacillus sp. JCM 19046]|nr:hypothetical protein JCM19045_2561 [Bacillus sp. JCM 19045]GAF16991.1 hypothetical protein JCM19046_1462 [Bacillus sp. JCM 19046]